jgi:hypothetical protein
MKRRLLAKSHLLEVRETLYLFQQRDSACVRWIQVFNDQAIQAMRIGLGKTM